MDTTVTRGARFFCLLILISLFAISTLSVSYVDSGHGGGHCDGDDGPDIKTVSIDTHTKEGDSVTFGSEFTVRFSLINPCNVSITQIEVRFFPDTTVATGQGDRVIHARSTNKDLVVPAETGEVGVMVDANFEFLEKNVIMENLVSPPANDSTNFTLLYLNVVRFRFSDSGPPAAPGQNYLNPGNKDLNETVKFYHKDGDFDGDGATNSVEAFNRTDFTKNDTDGDGLSDGDELKTPWTNPLTNDTDADGLTDWEEVNDMSLDSSIDDSLLKGADPNNADTDSDGALDGKEVELGSNLTNNDTDDDGLLDGTEINLQAITISYQNVTGYTEELRVENLNVTTDLFDNDTDGDGLLDGAEINLYDTDPTDNDTDGDNLLDGAELVNLSTDPLDIDTNNDGVSDDNDSDPTNMDIDNDGLSNSEESQIGTNIRDNDSDDDRLSDFEEVRTYNTKPLDNDTDNDGLLDGDEIKGYTRTGFNYTSDPFKADTDEDTLSDFEEVEKGTDGYITNPRDTDTDDDGLLDHEEGPRGTKTDPTKADTDNDGLDDLREGVLETNATNNDTDGDGLSDGEEENAEDRTNPKDNDSDDDGLSDGAEVNEYETDPNKADTDGDGFSDYDEVTRYDTDPLDPDSFPTGLVSDTTGQNMNGDDGSGIAFWVYIVILLVAVAVIGAIVALSMVRARTQ